MDGSSIRRDPLLATGTPATIRQLAAALIDAGHRRLAIVTPRAGTDDAARATLDDLCALTSAARLPPGRLISIEDGPNGTERAFFQIFRGTFYPTGLVCANVATAQAAVQSLRGLGFRVPGEMSVLWMAPPRPEAMRPVAMAGIQPAMGPA